MTDEKKELPSEGKTKVVAILGRFQPPTLAHYAVMNTSKKWAKKHIKLGVDVLPCVVVIAGKKSSEDKSRNPLTADERIDFMKASGLANGIRFLTATDAFNAFVKLREAGYEPIAVAGGDERVDDYLKILDEYFNQADGSKIKHYPITIKRPETNPEEVLADIKDGKFNVKLVSATVARKAVELGYKEEFAEVTGLTDKPDLAKKLFDMVAKSIGGK